RISLFIFVLLGGFDGSGRIGKTGKAVRQAFPEIFDTPNWNKNEHNCFHSLGQGRRTQRRVDELYANERRDESTEAVNEKIANQNLGRANGAIFHPGEGERNERDDNQ